MHSQVTCRHRPELEQDAAAFGVGNAHAYLIGYGRMEHDRGGAEPLSQQIDNGLYRSG
jgi:hypothetical protein